MRPHHTRSRALIAGALIASAPAAFAEPMKGGDTVALEEAYFEPLGLAHTRSSPPALMPKAMPLQDDYESNFYVRIGGGLVTTTDSDGPGEEIEFDEGLLGSIAFGKRFPGNHNNLGFDLEIEGIYADQDADDDGLIQAINDVTTAGGLINGILDYRLAERFSIYGGVGAGVAWMDIGTESDALNDFDDEDGPFLAWQGRAGVKLHTGGGAINLGYRFLNIDDVEIDDDVGGANFDLETEQHVLEIGYTFGAASF